MGGGSSAPGLERFRMVGGEKCLEEPQVLSLGYSVSHMHACMCMCASARVSVHTHRHFFPTLTTVFWVPTFCYALGCLVTLLFDLIKFHLHLWTEKLWVCYRFLICFEALVSFHGFLHPHSQHSVSGMSAASPKPLPPPLPVHLFLDLFICVHGVVGEGLFLLTGCACQYHFPSPGSLWLLLTLLSRVHGWTPRGSDNPISTKEKLRRNSVMWALSNLVILLYHIVLITQVLLFLPVEKADKLQDNVTALLGLADVEIHQPPIPSSIGERVALP